MKKQLTIPGLIKALDWSYEKVLQGIPGLDSAIVIADKFMQMEGSPVQNANALIRWQNAKAGSSGFITGIGGLITLPVAIPANVASVLFIQVRMIAALAHMGGYNLRDDKVKSMIYLCLLGNIAKDMVQEAGILLGTKLTARAIERISERSLIQINERIGFRLLTLYGGKGIINLGKAVPLVGGMIGGTVDLVTTNMVGNMARNMFLPKEELKFPAKTA
jgi:hypothetical protein